MPISRKDFFKKACLSGACICGLSSLASASDNDTTNTTSAPENTPNPIIQDWINNILSSMDSELSEDQKNALIRKSYTVHYQDLKMEDMLADYIGDLERFLKLLEEKWGWKIMYDEATKTVIANENKDFCVCPILNHEKGIKTPAMCYCAEGFTEKMFSVVAGKKATATVVSSIQRGDKNCVYKVVFG